MADVVQEIAIDADARKRLVRLLRAAYPHPTFPDGPYERTADAVIARASESVYGRIGLEQGLGSLDAKADGSFLELSDQAAYDLLVGIEGAAFFAAIRGVAVVSLYNDPEVVGATGLRGRVVRAGRLPEPRLRRSGLATEPTGRGVRRARPAGRGRNR